MKKRKLFMISKVEADSATSFMPISYGWTKLSVEDNVIFLLKEYMVYLGDS